MQRKMPKPNKNSHWYSFRISGLTTTTATTTTTTMNHNQQHKKPCKNFARGNCSYGPKCNFSHKTCPYDLAGSCKRGNTCFYVHLQNKPTPSTQSHRPCKHFANGHCKRGEECEFSHEVCSFDLSGIFPRGTIALL